jgi:hypothetical protein
MYESLAHRKFTPNALELTSRVKPAGLVALDCEGVPRLRECEIPVGRSQEHFTGGALAEFLEKLVVTRRLGHLRILAPWSPERREWSAVLDASVFATLAPTETVV